MSETVRQMPSLPAEQMQEAVRSAQRLGLQRQSAPGHRHHLPQGRAARLAHAFHLHLRDLEYLHHRRDGFRLFHRPSAGDRARILAAGTQRAAGSRKTFLAFVALVFPDLQLSIWSMTSWPAPPFRSALFAKTAVLGCVYTSVYLFFAWVFVSRKEL